MKKFIADTDDDFYRAVKVACAEDGVTLRSVILDLLREWLDCRGRCDG